MKYGENDNHIKACIKKKIQFIPSEVRLTLCWNIWKFLKYPKSSIDLSNFILRSPNLAAATGSVPPPPPLSPTQKWGLNSDNWCKETTLTPCQVVPRLYLFLSSHFLRINLNLFFNILNSLYSISLISLNVNTFHFSFLNKVLDNNE